MKFKPWPLGPSRSHREPTPSAADSRIGGLAAEDKRLLISLARRALTEQLTVGEVSPPPTTESTALLEPAAAFVTLRHRVSDDLRGCRGESRACRPLIEAVVFMAIAAATDDPRFPPVQASELPDLRIEINILTPVQPIRADRIEVGRHGLLIEMGSRRGLLLPEVPIHHGWDREGFLAALCQKAGLPLDAWRDPDAQLSGFETEAWREED